MKVEKIDKNQVSNPISDPISDAINSKQTTDNYWEVEGLPSAGKFYPAGTTIKARPLKTLEVKMLSSMNETNAEHIMNDTIRKAMIGINVEDLLLADKLYLIFWLRANTYKESGFEVNFECELCGKESGYEFDLDLLNITEYNENLEYDKEVTLPQSKQTIRVKLETVKDEIRLKNFINKNKNSMMKFDDEILSLANVISHIDGQEANSLLNNYEFLTELPPSDFTFIVSYVNHVEIGISNLINVKCNNCGGDTRTGVTFRSEFFVPQYRFK